MNIGLARRVKILRFQVIAFENQTQETFGDAGGEEYKPQLSRRIGWFSELEDENDRGGFPAARHLKTIKTS